MLTIQIVLDDTDPKIGLETKTATEQQLITGVLVLRVVENSLQKLLESKHPGALKRYEEEEKMKRYGSGEVISIEKEGEPKDEQPWTPADTAELDQENEK